MYSGCGGKKLLTAALGYVVGVHVFGTFLLCVVTVRLCEEASITIPYAFTNIGAIVILHHHNVNTTSSSVPGTHFKPGHGQIVAV